MWGTVLTWVGSLVVYKYVLDPLTTRLDTRLQRRGTSVAKILTGPVAELLLGASTACWFFSEVRYDIPAHYAIWQITVSLVLILVGVGLVVHALRRWRRSGGNPGPPQVGD